jgi:rhamnulokinase
MEYYLAIDMGASGGRHMLGHEENGQVVLEEMHRFSNKPEKKGNALVWDEQQLFNEIVSGLKKCAAAGKIPVSIGIDTWGVDYVLLDSQGKEILPAHSYRDTRTEAFMNTVVPFEELYAVSGIARQPFNTVYQLLADKASGRLDKARHMLFLPEYFSYRLTGALAGKTASEYTMSSTSGLLDAKKRNWAFDIIERLGLPAGLFKDVKEPPYAIGTLSGALQKELGFNAEVIMIACHDTASAVNAAKPDALYISSGTWSLLGIQGTPILTEEARLAGYTNEGALNGKIRFLKNIMGLWILQSVRHELKDAYSFAQLEEMARKIDAELKRKAWAIDVNRNEFFSPESMIDAVKKEYKRTGQAVPETAGELACCIYHSLAQSYKTAIEDLQRITGKTYTSISIIGGGSKDNYLNELTEAYTGKKVYTGPVEATAMGNIMLQIKKQRS